MAVGTMSLMNTEFMTNPTNTNQRKSATKRNLRNKTIDIHMATQIVTTMIIMAPDTTVIELTATDTNTEKDIATAIMMDIARAIRRRTAGNIFRDFAVDLVER
jgi:hypothetical protein